MIKIKHLGWPDRLLLLPGPRVFLVEFKKPGKRKRTSIEQRAVHRFLRGLGCRVEVIDSEVDFRAMTGL